MPDFGRWTGNGGDPSLNEINRDERFLDALASGQPVYATDSAEAELAFLLSDWRDGIRDTPTTAIVTPRDAAIALRGTLDARKRTRTSLTLVGSAAAALLVLGGFSAAVYGAGPGDSLYGVRTQLFGEQPSERSDQVMLASQQLAEVQQLVEKGDWQQAQDRLQTLSTTVQSVDRVEDKQQLVQQWNALAYKVVEQNPAATLPPPDQPLPVLPSSPLTLLQVPVITETSTETSTSSSTSESSPTSPSESTGTPTSTPPTDVMIATTPSTSPPSSSTSTSPPSTSTPTSSSTPPSSTTNPTTTTTTTTANATTTTTSRQPVALPPSSLPPSTVSVPSSAPAVQAPPPVSAPPPASVPPAVQAPPPVSQAPAVVAPPPVSQAPAVVAPPPVSAPKPVEEPVKPPPALKEPEQVVTTTVAAPSRNEN
ncbi:MAG: hypothetical protein QOK02_1467 [Mycobacterium sp.]|jgi:hypothetical protein|nr:hypothetical protein [Mycobacterium sp.]